MQKIINYLKSKISSNSIDKNITFFSGKWKCFSNFASYSIEIDGDLWMTSEHAYQAFKFKDENIREQIKKARSAYDAKMIADFNKDKIIDNWEDMRIEAMYKIIEEKFKQHYHIRKKLMETGNRNLIEASPYDSFWGWGKDKKGENNLGKIWMRIREKYYDQSDIIKKCEN